MRREGVVASTTREPIRPASTKGGVLMPTLAYLGLDIAHDSARVCFLLADGAEPRPRWIIPNSQPGADALSEELHRLCLRYHVEQLRIGLEATGLLWWHLACALKDAQVLAPGLCPQSATG
jgi:hypothetical protein